MAVHERDFVPGQSIESNMRHFVYKSRRTIALISSHYLNSPYCIQELEMAISASGVSNRRLVAVVLDIEALEAFMQLNGAAKSFFKSYTYLSKYCDLSYYAQN